MSEIRDKLKEIESKFAEDIDYWYLEAKEYLNGCGPHWLGRKKELIKTHLFYLGEYVEEIKTGEKSNNKSKLINEIELWTWEALTTYSKALEIRINEPGSIKSYLIKDFQKETEKRNENE